MVCNLVQVHKEFVCTKKFSNNNTISGVLHLYYARFISHFLHSEGLLPSQEPFEQLLVQGIVMGKTYQGTNTKKYLKADEVEEKEGQYIQKNTKEPVEVSWEKMSKSKHNGIDPIELVDKYGIDVTRLLILADVPPNLNRNWSDQSKSIKNICTMISFTMYSMIYM